MTYPIIIFVAVCVLCAVLLLSAMIFGSRQDHSRELAREEQNKEKV